MAITKEQARKIADAFLESAKAVEGYLDANYGKIDHTEYKFLNGSGKTLLCVSSSLTTIAVGLAINDLKDPATKLKNVVKQAKKKIKKTQEVARVIRVVAGLADLAAGIMAKDPNAIVTSISKLNDLDDVETG